MTATISPTQFPSTTEVVSRSTVDLERPWLGLEPYAEEHKQFFFGRDEELFEVTERIKHKRLTILFGQSGLGKTSLLRAGVIPKLRESGYIPVTIRLNFENESTNLESQVVDAILQQCRLPIPKDLSNVSLWELLHDPRYGVVDSRYTETFQPVLIFDQFEEIWTLGQAKCPEACRKFMEDFSAIVEGRPPSTITDRMEKDVHFADTCIVSQSPVKFLLTLREDYLHWIERWRSKMPSVMENRFEILALRGPQAFEAAFNPGCLRCEADSALSPIVNEETARAIVSFVAGKKETCPLDEIDNVPPLLSLVCEQLNRDRIDKNQSHIGVSSPKDTAPYVLNAFYESCFEGLPEAVREFVEQELISESGFRESVSMDRACSKLESKGVQTPEKILQDLVNKRVLTIDQRGDTGKIELTHDVLTPIARQSRLRRAEIRSGQLRKERIVKQALTAALAVFVLATIGLSIYSSIKAVEANQERDNANAQMLVAQQEKQRAIQQQAEADTQRRVAEKERSNALQSQMLAEEEANRASLAKLEAEKSRIIAERETERAKLAERNAEAQRTFAEQKRLEAVNEHRKFVQAERQFRRDSSRSHYSYGLSSLAQDVMGGRFGAKSYSGGISQWNEALAAWARSMAIDGENVVAANTAFATLGTSGNSRIQLPRIVAQLKQTNPIASGIAAGVAWLAYPTEIVSFDLDSGEKHLVTSETQIEYCYNMSRDGCIGFASDDGTFHVFDLVAKDSVIRAQLENPVRAVDLGPAGDRLALFTDNQSYVAFAEKGRNPKAIETEGLSKSMGHRWLSAGWVTSRFDADQWSIAFEGKEDTLDLKGALYHFQAFGDQLLTVRQGPSGESTETSESGTTRVGQFIELWNAADLTRTAVVEVDSRVIKLDMSPAHDVFVTWGSSSGGGCSPMGASSDPTVAKQVNLYSTENLSGGSRVLSHPAYVEWLSFSPDGDFLWTLDAESTLRAWNLVSANQELEIRHTPGSVAPLGVSTGTCFVTGEDGYVREYATSKMGETPFATNNFFELVKDDENTSVSEFGYDPQSKVVTARTYSGRFVKMDPRLDQAVLVEGNIEEAMPPSVDTPDGRVAISYRFDDEKRFLEVRNLDKEELIVALELSPEATVAALSSDGTLLAYAVAPKVAAIYDLAKGESLPGTFVAPSRIYQLDLDRERNLLVAQSGSAAGCGGEPESIALIGWNIRTGTFKWSPIPGVTSFKRSRDNESLLTQSEDHSLRWINIDNGLPNSAVIFPEGYSVMFSEGDNADVYVLSGNVVTRRHLPRFDRQVIAAKPTPEVLEWIELAVGVRYREGLYSTVSDKERLKLLEIGPDLPAPWRELHLQLFEAVGNQPQPGKIKLVRNRY